MYTWEIMMRMRSAIFLNSIHYNSHSVSTLKWLSCSLFTLTIRILILINVVVITMVNIPPSLRGLLCPNWCLPSSVLCDDPPRILPHWKLSQLRTMFQVDQCSRSSKHDLKKKEWNCIINLNWFNYLKSPLLWTQTYKLLETLGPFQPLHTCVMSS